MTTHGLSPNFFNTGDTLASRIAGQFQGAASNLQIASLFYLALILLVLSLVFNLIALVIIRRVERSTPMSAGDHIRSTSAAASEETTGGRAAGGVVNVVMVGVCSLAALLAVLSARADRLHGRRPRLQGDQPRFLHASPRRSSASAKVEGAGVANAIVGSLIIVAIATVIAFPIGVLVAIFTSEFASNRLEPVRSAHA